MSLLWRNTSNTVKARVIGTKSANALRGQLSNLRPSSSTRIAAVSANRTDSQCPSLKESLHCVFTNKVFVLFAIGTGIVMSISSLSIYMVDTMQNDHQQFSFIWLAPVLYNLTNLLGRLSYGLLKLIPHSSSLDISILSAILNVIGCLLIAFVTSAWFKVAAWCIIGMSMGLCGTSTTIATARLLGRHNLAHGIGLVLTIVGIVGLVCGPLNGYIRDVTGSYQLVFVCNSAISSVAGCIFVVAKVIRLRENRAVDETRT